MNQQSKVNRFTLQRSGHIAMNPEALDNNHLASLSVSDLGSSHNVDDNVWYPEHSNTSFIAYPR